MGYTPVVFAKSAEAIENKRVELHGQSKRKQRAALLFGVGRNAKSAHQIEN